MYDSVSCQQFKVCILVSKHYRDGSNIVLELKSTRNATLYSISCRESCLAYVCPTMAFVITRY